MNLDFFLERIDAQLSGDDKMGKIIQVADLKHFTKCYSTSINLLGCIQYEINIVEIDGLRAGVLFCDCNKLENNSLHPFLYTPFSSEFFREQVNIDEFWFVFVEEKLIADAKVFDEFIAEYDLTTHYDKVLLFNYFESTILDLRKG